MQIRIRRWQPFAAAALAVLAVIAWLALRGGTPEEFEGRTRVPACGTVEEARVGAAPATAAERCLDRALRTGAGGELVVNGMSDEGAPVYTYYRAVPGEPGLELFGDSSRNGFAADEWTYRRCPGATGVRALGRCASRAL